MLGNCPQKNILLVTRRHHRVKHAILEQLRNLGFYCHATEVYAVNSERTARFADIVAFHCDRRRAFILETTTRFKFVYYFFFFFFFCKRAFSP
ncbi:hypothetical protein O3M35_010847 [Rhynocoris fuscipes]|uniref:Uncharacterized protein n=1 Tax=Rhynocoris fuscipes TaxID=488301 RepID=A0AAW1D0L0_9HEMI